MRRLSLLLTLLTLALHANLIFNGSFEMGTDGFAVERFLRPDTNPKLEFIPLRLAAGAPGSGANALRVENLFAERLTLFSREFRLKTTTRYRLTGKIRATDGEASLRIAVFKVDDKWLAFSLTARTTPEWQDFSLDFTTEEREGNGWYHLQIGISSSEPTACSLELDDLRLTAAEGDAEQPRVCAALVPDSPLHLKGETASLTLKLTNPAATPFRETLTLSANDDYTGRQLLSRTLPVELAPGETKAIPLPPLPLGLYGGFRLKVTGNGLDTLDQFLAVIGDYQPKPLDLTRDMAVGLNGGLNFRMPPSVTIPCYQVFNAPLERRFELYAKLGCRILRDHDGGMRGVDWPAVEWERGQFDFSHLDRQLALYDRNHITLFPVMGSGFIENTHNWQNQAWPLWAVPLCERVKNPPPNCMASVRDKILLPPRDLFRNYIRETVRHLAGRIPVYEIANEPNLYLAPEAYVAYLKEAHDAIREADPNARISGFCLTSDFGAAATPWMQQCVRLGGLDYVDVIGFHPYAGRELGSLKPADAYIDSLRAELKGYGRPDLPLWNTELYYLVERQVKHDSYIESIICPNHIICRFLIDLGEGVVQSISLHENQQWKRLLTPSFLSGGSNYHELIPSENSVALNTLARLFEAAKPLRKLKLGNGVVCYAFRKDGRPIAAIWQYQKKQGIHADLSAFEVLDLYGNPEPNGEKALSEAPLYLLPGNLSDDDFLARLERLQLRLDQPVLGGELARKVGDALLVTLHNESDQPQQGLAGLSGSGLAARAKHPFSIPPKASLNLEIPVMEVPDDGRPLELLLHLNGTLFRSPLKLVANRLLGRSFAMDNATGTIAFGDGAITVTLQVRDASDAGPNGTRNPWETDCAELFFDLNPRTIPQLHAQAYTPQTFRLLITPRDPQRRLHAIGTVSPEDCRLDVASTADGYSITLTIPAKTGDLLGFDLKLDDAGADGTAVRETTLGAGTELFKNRCSFSVVR
ncbi:MAG: hypothetical protein ACI4WT_00925 [Oligosphaeraceae bacterium]